MKQLSFLFVLFCLLANSSRAVTVSGTVTNLTTSAVVSGQKVYIIDSSYATPIIIYSDSTVTNSSGVYSFTIPSTISSGYCILRTMGCSGWNYNTGSVGSTNATINLNICPPAPPAAIFTGTITLHTGGPAVGARVWIVNSSVGNFITTTTNSSGGYSLTAPSNWTLGNSIFMNDSAATGGCKNYGVFGGSFAGTNKMTNDTLCKYAISGVVTLQGGGPAANAKVYLINQTLDSTTTPADTVLTAYDSTVTNATGYYSFGRNNYYISVQRVKAALQPSSSNYSSYLPTYHDSSLIWSSATTFGGLAWATRANDVNISLRGGTNPGGLGFIGGHVVLGANKTTAVGDPLANRILMVTNASGKAIAYAYSDVSGQFSFPNLPYGTYNIFGDAWGKTNPALIVTLSASQASVGNITFEENSTTFKGHIGNLSVGGTALQAIYIYPNPAHTYVALNGLSAVNGNKTVVIRDVTGSIISNTAITTGNTASISINELPAGMYMLQLQTSEGATNFRFVKD